MLEVAISDFNELVLSDIELTFEKIDSSNIMNEIHELDKHCKYEQLLENTMAIVENIISFREKLKNDLEKIEKSYNKNWEKDQNEWTFERERMAHKIRSIVNQN